MRSALKVFGTLVLGAFGLVWTYWGLVRLGWLRHGNRSLDFLHLDWIFQPHLPYWGAHMANLFKLALGLACLFGALYRLYRMGYEWRKARRAIRESESPDETDVKARDLSQVNAPDEQPDKSA